MTYDGIRIDPYISKDFKILIKTSHTKKIDECELGSALKFIYKTVVLVKIKCKGQTFYSKSFEYMFAGNSSKDINTNEIVQMLAWQRKSKYFIRLSIRDKQIIKREKGFFSFQTHGYAFFI